MPTLPAGLGLPLVFDQVVIRLKDQPLLALDRTIAAGEVLTLMGPSGSGKSSLLNLISGFLPKDFAVSGDIRLGDRSLLGLAPQRRHVGLMFQSPLLFPHLSVGANVLAGLPRANHPPLWHRLTGHNGARRRQQAEQALESVGLGGFFDRDPATLSGGQQTRVALIRLLVSEPQALLLDEPFSSLDLALRAEIRDLAFAQARKRALPVLLVTHDPADADAAGGTIISL